MQMIGHYRKINVFVNCAVCFSLLRIRIANKLEVDAIISGWSKTGLEKIVLSNSMWFYCVEKYI